MFMQVWWIVIFFGIFEVQSCGYGASNPATAGNKDRVSKPPPAAKFSVEQVLRPFESFQNIKSLPKCASIIESPPEEKRSECGWSGTSRIKRRPSRGLSSIE